MTETRLQYDIFSLVPPAGYELNEQAKRLAYQRRDGGTFCVIHLWPAQQGSSDPQANFKSDWDSFAGNFYKIGAPQQTNTASRDGWQAVTGAGLAEADGVRFLVSVSTFTQGDISWSVVTVMNDDRYAPDVDNFLTLLQADVRRFMPKTPARPGFTFTVTNFDDGWVSVPKENWVQSTKGRLTALIHYPDKKVDEYNPDSEASFGNAWNALVAPRYGRAKYVELKAGSVSDLRPDFGHAETVEIASGKSVYVMLYRTRNYSGKHPLVEIIAPDKSSFEREFGSYESNSANRAWQALDNMGGRNKFAVGPADLNGVWTNDFSAATQYVFVATGLPAFMDTFGSTESFRFSGNGQYRWEIAIASGAVGNIQFKTGASAGNVSVPDDWHVHFSDISGRPRTFDARFSCIGNGLRILWLDNAAYAKKE